MTSELSERIAEYRAEFDMHRDAVRRVRERDEEIRVLRDAEPIVVCVALMPNRAECGWQMRRGDYRCSVCGTPNPEWEDRGVAPIRLSDAWYGLA